MKDEIPEGFVVFRKYDKDWNIGDTIFIVNLFSRIDMVLRVQPLCWEGPFKIKVFNN